MHQATILAYSEFGKEAITANVEQLNDAYIPNYLVLRYLGQLGLGKISAKIAGYAIPLFLVQSVPAFVYGCFNSVKNRRNAALVIWLLPAVLGLPGFLFTVAYLIMSPLCAVFTFPGFMFALYTMGQTHKEDFAEGMIFTVAAIG
ncbi:MAG: hypothetical protein LH660_05785 [Phormidesmis sp. CAN_BIN36]|nr:hypothetical protein [Phormidesmis sp. CAN_BIN36]